MMRNVIWIRTVLGISHVNVVCTFRVLRYLQAEHLQQLQVIHLLCLCRVPILLFIGLANHCILDVAAVEAIVVAKPGHANIVPCCVAEIILPIDSQIGCNPWTGNVAQPKTATRRIDDVTKWRLLSGFHVICKESERVLIDILHGVVELCICIYQGTGVERTIMQRLIDICQVVGNSSPCGRGWEHQALHIYVKRCLILDDMLQCLHSVVVAFRNE
mmetsp:Transcript_62734/g.111440  ORF Transcript_62734/g.111440 Transcript_62734/m.111440 type:complete len:216 (-) Transcript_62734:23-670(-)